MSQTDYYRILQVHPEAEQEIIEAAYRRLMRKYHPDVLESTQREEPEVKRRVQEINEAYEIIGNVQKRAEYDNMLRSSRNAQSLFSQQFTTDKTSSDHSVEIEKRLYPGRCTQTKQTFQILMARRKGSTGPFRGVGLTPLEEAQQPKLNAPQKQNSIIEKIFGRNSQQHHARNHKPEVDLPSDQELQKMFD